ncbi:hypothetical protein PYCCODRAFT_926731 [Trametes coccinea BRFM310]|uniref:Uncharacterized protein n=1 Tax=Trametes coccinea (strain BRFM310) TaxID=1353009 RepID=A0A1Y2IZ05_TRAC3|nr:hypothetical protein PYCCODRAFT_926731 [Trametes coccinea BRFM310]
MAAHKHSALSVPFIPMVNGGEQSSADGFTSIPHDSGFIRTMRLAYHTPCPRLDIRGAQRSGRDGKYHQAEISQTICMAISVGSSSDMSGTRMSRCPDQVRWSSVRTTLKCQSCGVISSP